jgi:hypothetical protein
MSNWFDEQALYDGEMYKRKAISEVFLLYRPIMEEAILIPMRHQIW